jgi:hypothetical protein
MIVSFADLIGGPRPRLSSSAKAGDPVFQRPVSEPRGRCVLDTPLSCLVPGDRFVAFVPRNDVIPIAGTSPRSRGAICPSCCMSHPRKQRAQGKPGARCTRSLVCSVLVAHECSHHRFTGTPGLPCAMVLTVSFVLSPVTGLVCHRHLAGQIPRNLTPASGRQDHTTSPSASASFVQHAIGAPDAAASTASRTQRP